MCFGKKKAYDVTEDGLFYIVTKQWPIKPQIAVVGSCYLVGVIWGGMLYDTNNVGFS
jgi:pyruvate dehydrogenase phosphatase